MNGVGAAVTAVVLLVVAVTKAMEGAWIIMLLIPTNVLFCRLTRKHYDRVAAQLSVRGWEPRGRRHNTVLVPISGIQRAVLGALDYAKTLSSDVRAVYVNVDPTGAGQMHDGWKQWGNGVPLILLESPFRSLMEPLLENAAQYSAPASPISVGMAVSPEGLAITVRDHGPGIASADLPHLFDRFYRGQGARQRISGTGMGLSIARGMLAAEGGRVWAENCPDGGSRFTIVVPAERREAAAADHA